jgi:hypothetical protein
MNLEKIMRRKEGDTFKTSTRIYHIHSSKRQLLTDGTPSSVLAFADKQLSWLA